MGPAKFMVLFSKLFIFGGSQFGNQPVWGPCTSDNYFTDILYIIIICTHIYSHVCILLVYSLVGSCGVGGSGDLVRRGAGGVLPPHHPHPHPADFPHPLRFNCMDICSSFATVGSLSKYNKHNDNAKR